MVVGEWGEDMIVERVIRRLSTFPPEREVKVRVGDDMGPAHYTLDVEENGLGDAVIVCTHKVDDPETHYEAESPVSKR